MKPTPQQLNELKIGIIFKTKLFLNLIKNKFLYSEINTNPDLNTNKIKQAKNFFFHFISFHFISTYQWEVKYSEHLTEF